MKHLTVRFSTLILTKDELAAIGSLAVESTYCEQMVESVIWQLAGLTDEKGKYFTQGIQMGGRLDLLRDLGKKQLASEDERTYFGEIVSRLKECNVDRNTVIHGNWNVERRNISKMLAEGPSVKRPATAKKRTPNSAPREFKSADIDNVAQRISDLTTELMLFVAAHWPDRIA